MIPIIDKLRENVRSSIRAKESFLEMADRHAVFSKAVERVIAAYKNGGRLYIAGNGGSAADSQHIAAEFVSKLARPRAALPAEALTTDTSTLTAIGNDFGYEEIFARQLAGKASEKDVFLGITTSGKSKNIVRALEECRARGIASIVFTGFDGGAVRAMADYCIIAPGSETSNIQEIHIVLGHTLCGCVEEALFPE